ncbi:MAG: PstS family phosphate ABC transporter substrate-binding protein [Deltaproteobacteria bacterium]|nr:PstS family phosphate ABC transporter substrate-binding protein [Deltaproteobacteria bacterium]
MKGKLNSLNSLQSASLLWRALKHCLFFILCLLINFTSLFSPAELQAQPKATLRVSGSSTLLPVTETAAEEYLKGRPDLLLTVSGTGTGEGIRSLIDGNIDIADASREAKFEEIERAKKGGVELIRHVVALDCLAVVVHPSNPLTNISMRDLKGVYDGSVVNWKQLGGPDMVIVPINRDSSSGTFEMWVEEVLGWARHRPDAQVQSSSGGVAYAVSGNRYAIGYVSLGFISEDVKALSVDGVMPSHDTAIDGTYPIKRDLYMYVRADHAPEVDKFLDFIFSPAGRKIVEDTGFLPTPNYEDNTPVTEGVPESPEGQALASPERGDFPGDNLSGPGQTDAGHAGHSQTSHNQTGHSQNGPGQINPGQADSGQPD